jgi:hypothetical protein
MNSTTDCPICACKTCPDGMCMLFCENGFKEDDKGCDVCECEACPKNLCFLACEHGFEKDEAGCDLCECWTAPTAEANGVSRSLVAFVIVIVCICLVFMIVATVLSVIAFKRNAGRPGFRNLRNESVPRYEAEQNSTKSPMEFTSPCDEPHCDEPKSSLA